MRLLFLNPAALALLPLALMPLLVHLLVKRPTRRTPFPTLRFVTAGASRAARLRKIDDWVLLSLRTAIVVVAVLALARPLALSPWRARAWEERVVRLIVVDSSASARSGIAGGREIAARESRTAYASRIVETDTVSRELKHAAEWLASLPPARREVVVVSDFQEATITPSVIEALPRGAGLRLIQSASPERVVAPRPAGLPAVLVSPGEDAAARRAIEAVARANGIAANAVDARVLVATKTAPTLKALIARARPPSAPWMADVIRAVAESPALDSAAQNVDARSVDGRLLIVTEAAPRAMAFPVLLDAVHQGLTNEHDAREALLPRVDRAKLAELERAPAGVPAESLERSPDDDARWFWVAVAALLACETWLRSRIRRRPSSSAPEARAA